MANTIRGKILAITQPVNVSKTGNPFYKRELVLDASRTDDFTGEVRENFPMLTFTSKNCEKLDGFQVGEPVEVSFVLQGRAYQRDGQTRYITDAVGYKVERIGNQQKPAYAPQQPGVQQPTAALQQPYQQPAYPPQQPYAPQTPGQFPFNDEQPF